MKKTIRFTEKAPRPIGPYSQAVRLGNFLHVSGQAGVDPDTKRLVPGGVEPETRRILESLRAILAEYGLKPSAIVKALIFLTDMEDLARVNGLWGSFVVEPYPARTVVGVEALPLNARIEIEVVAVV